MAIRDTTDEVKNNPMFGLIDAMNIENVEKRGQMEATMSQ